MNRKLGRSKNRKRTANNDQLHLDDNVISLKTVPFTKINYGYRR